jgi:hypothetical protein
MGNIAPEPGAAVPGTGVPDAATDPNVTGDVNPNVGQTQGVPENIPYARFKEVNDQLRPYKELERVGYDADSLHRLAEWELRFQQNPVENWLSVAKNLELPEEIKEAILTHYGESDDGDYDEDEGEEEATAIPEDYEEVRDYVRTKKAEEVQQGRVAVLNEILDLWAKDDVAAGLKPEEQLSEQQKLTFIAGSAGTGGNTTKGIAEAARGEWLKVRQLAQGSMVKPGGPGVPRAVPGSAAPTGSERPVPRTFDEMNKLIKAAEAAGTL